ncbi:uncharacterized protein, PEP-CTERM system associated [Verrucomicrobium sp. GAS474]|uniref:hypothetical protein n=1 Tax=Verrucomicrobium sp. GAS474 TaxID=1882831 RepID=UPI00087B1F7C|nr:hypothetical protein [Verrucomicrobium sp. GAS474]SDT86196.1 uncharacterized protein, PEP-CTERM system associated [Verrucomicrobium sp. GAS474]
MPLSRVRPSHRVWCGVVGIFFLGAFPNGKARAQELTDHLPAPQVLIPRTNLVPADANYTAVTPRMMNPNVPLRGDGNVAAPSVSPSGGSSATATAKKPKRDSMSSVYDAPPVAASPSVGSTGSTPGNAAGTDPATARPGTTSTAANGATGTNGVKKAAGTTPKTNSNVASAPSGASPADNALPGASDAALMDSMGTDLHLEGPGPLVITDTDSPPSASPKTATLGGKAPATNDDAPRMRAAVPQVAGAQPNFRSTMPPLRAPRPPDQEYYNIKAGPALVRLNAGIRAEFNDNIALSNTDKKADFGITPGTTLNLKIPLTVVNGVTTNQINLDLGIAYTYWLKNGGSFSPLSTLNMSPGSSLSFSILAGDDVVITLFDNFGFQSAPINVVDVQGVNAFEVFENTMGLNAAWDLGYMTLNAGYGYGLSIHPQQEFGGLDNQSHNFSLAGTFVLSESTTAGVSATLNRTEFTDTSDPNSTIGMGKDNFWNMSLGPFITHRISDFMSISATAGFSQYIFDTQPDPGTSLYYSVIFQHKLNSVVSYTVQAGRSTQLGTSSDLLDTTTVAFRPSYQFLPNWTIGSDFFYQNAHAVGGSNSGEDIDRYGLGVGVTHAFGDRLSGSATYRYTWKDSTIQSNEYQQNLLTFSVDYAF